MKKIISLLFTVLLFFVFSISASAESSFEYYTYWSGYATKKAYETKATYTIDNVIDGNSIGISSFASPTDMCFDGELIYILDSGADRIVILDENYNLYGVIESFTYNEEIISLSNSTGIFVNDDTLCVANPEQGKIFMADKTGAVYKIIERPDSKILPDSFNFKPSKLVIDSRGFMYVACEECYYGALVFDKDGNFLSLFGSNKVEGTVLDAFQKVWDLITQNSAKRANDVQNLPYQFVNIHIDENDFIYTATGKANSYGTVKGQLKKLSPSGSSILKYKNGYKSESASNFDFGDTEIPVDSTTNMKRILNFVSLTTENGYIYALDRTYGKIFVYDNSCNCVTVFGSSNGNSKYDGTFTYVSDILTVNGDILVLDTENNNITVFEPTDYLKKIMQANNLTATAQYDEAKPIWEEVLREDKNCQLAYKGLARSYINDGDYEKALEYAKEGVDQDLYSQAFTKVRTSYLAKNFVWIFISAILLIAIVIILLIIKKKRDIHLIKNIKLKVLFSAFLHPFDTFNNIKYKGNGSSLIATVILLIFAIMSVLQKIYGGFMYTVFEGEEFNPLLSGAASLAIVVLWSIINWGVCTLASGKGKLKEIYISTCYCLMPIIAYQILFITLSHFMTNESALIGIIGTCCYIFAGWLLSIAMITVHEYSFSKFIGTAVLTVLGMLFVVFILFMLFTLGQQFISFVSTIFQEVTYR